MGPRHCTALPARPYRNNALFNHMPDKNRDITVDSSMTTYEHNTTLMKAAWG
ncbi:MAG: hypothetical protein ACYCWE_11625 [Eubacteriales bacterium]